MAAYKFGAEKRELYLEAIRKGGRRIESCKAAGIHYETLRLYVNSHPEFQKEIDTAEIIACEPVENALYQRALAGNLGAIVFYLTNRCAQRWSDRRNPPVYANIEVTKDQKPADIIADLKKMLANTKED